MRQRLQTVDKPQGCIEGAVRHGRPGPSGPASAENQPKGRFSGRFGPFDFLSAGGGVYVAEGRNLPPPVAETGR